MFGVVDGGGRDGGARGTELVGETGGAPGGGAGVPLPVRGRRMSRSCQPNRGIFSASVRLCEYLVNIA